MGTDVARLNERPVKINRVAEMTGYSKGYVYQLVASGQIPYHKRGGVGSKSSVLFFESEIIDWIRNKWEFCPAQDDIHACAEKIVGGLA
ncbi:MAG: helix-turn-helix domain-containing protein [Spirochaetaceae bacterium]|nr:helix-turn-helix domain-containing protein [Spirochaetaceae bacterium]